MEYTIHSLSHSLYIPLRPYLNKLATDDDDDDDDKGWEAGWGNNAHDTAAYNGQEDRVYVPSTSTFYVQPAEYYALGRANWGLNLSLKKWLGSAGVTGKDSQDLKKGKCRENKYFMEHSLTTQLKWGGIMINSSKGYGYAQIQSLGR